MKTDTIAMATPIPSAVRDSDAGSTRHAASSASAASTRIGCRTMETTRAAVVVMDVRAIARW
ncbi:hypothetical protein [Luteimonas terrae]|uniref:Uncharacterized protein n=1 Tax=Luteimonas terrae TaxID=1530191 RepID=A0ABU1Y070_9GAMM|nr:hypothetical protein [Luteimonas terrae]MDR7194424.1 hypothetical protein [Luteimonas terrae]